MIKIIFIIALLISYYAEATSSMNGLQNLVVIWSLKFLVVNLIQ